MIIPNETYPIRELPFCSKTFEKGISNFKYIHFKNAPKYLGTNSNAISITNSNPSLAITY